MSDEYTQIAAAAYDALNKINTHEQICTERYTTINATLNDLKTGLKWLGGMMLAVLIAVLGWSLNQQVTVVNANQQAVNRQLLDMKRDYPANPAPQNRPVG